MNNPSKRFNFLIFLLVMIAAMMLLSGLLSGESYKKIGYSEMRALFLEEKVESFEWEDGMLTLKLNAPDAEGNTVVQHELASVDIFVDDLSGVYERQAKEGIIKSYNFVPVKETPWYLQMLPYLLISVILLVVVYFLMMRANGAGGGAMKFGKANIRVGSGEKKVTFADVAGADE